MRGAKPKPQPAPDSEHAQFAPPADLSREAAAEWQRIVALLAPMKVLSQLDTAALTIYCDAYAIYKKAQREIDVQGSVIEGVTGTPIKNPYLLVQKDCWDRMKTLLGELGLTPSGRKRIGYEPASVNDGPPQIVVD